MKNYRFLKKPLIFIFNILAASYFVLLVDEYHPNVKKKSVHKNLDSAIYKLVHDFKNKELDSTQCYERVCDLLNDNNNSMLKISSK